MAGESQKPEAQPRRRIEIRLKLGADSWDEVASAFTGLATDIHMGRLRGPASISGGYGYSYIYEAGEDESVTHESWYEALQSHLAKERATREPETEVER